MTLTGTEQGPIQQQQGPPILAENKQLHKHTSK